MRVLPAMALLILALTSVLPACDSSSDRVGADGDVAEGVLDRHGVAPGCRMEERRQRRTGGL